MDSDVETGPSPKKGKRHTQLNRVEYSGRKHLIFLNKHVYLNRMPQAGIPPTSIRVPFNNVHEEIDKICKDKVPHTWVIGKTDWFSYKPFFDLDIINGAFNGGEEKWKSELNIIQSVIEKLVNSRGTVYTRKPFSSVHIICEDIRIDYNHLMYVWKELQRRCVSPTFKIDVPGNFPLPYTSKDEKTFYTDAAGNVEPCVLWRDDEIDRIPYCVSGNFMSVSQHITLDVWNEVLDESSILFHLVQHILEVATGLFSIRQILQHLCYYPKYFKQPVLMALKKSNWDPDKITSLVFSLGWPDGIVTSFVVETLHDIYLTIAIMLARVPDVKFGSSPTLITEVASVEFIINGHVFEKLKGYDEPNKNKADPSDGQFTIEQQLRVVIVFFQHGNGFMLYTGSKWILAQRMTVLSFISEFIQSSEVVNMVFSKIGGRYGQVGDRKCDRHIYFRDGGMLYGENVIEVIPPLFAIVQAKVNMTLDEYRYVLRNQERLMAMLSKENIESENPISLNDSYSQSVITAFRFFYKVLGCDYDLFGVFMHFMSKISFLESNKNIVVFYGPSANNGKTLTLSVIEECLGSFMTAISAETIKKSRRELAPDLAKAAHCSIVYVDEACGTVMNAESIKSITGGARQYIRTLYKSGETIELKMNILITGNDTLQTDADYGVFNRLINFPFDVSFDKKALHLKAEPWSDKVRRIQEELASEKIPTDVAHPFTSGERGELAQGLGLILATSFTSDMFKDFTSSRINKRMRDTQNQESVPARKRRKVEKTNVIDNLKDFK